MLGPFGEVTVLAKSNQLDRQDSVKSLRNIIKTIDDVEKKEGGHDTFAHACVYIKARDAERTLIAQMGDPRAGRSRRHDAGHGAARRRRPAEPAAGGRGRCRKSACATSPPTSGPTPSSSPARRTRPPRPARS